MNKRGEEIVAWEFVKGAILFIILLVLLAGAYRGIPDSRLNSVKAEDLSLSISSVFLVDNDLNLVYDLKEEYFLDIDGNRVKLYKSEEGARGVSELFLDKTYNFGEQLNKKTSKVNIKKERNRVVVS